MTNVFRFTVLASTILFVFGCSSEGGSTSHTSNYYSARPSSFYYDSLWYGYPYYWYDSPDYIIVDPERPDRPGRPEHPIEPVPGDSLRPHLTPEQMARDSARASDRSRSRMPAARPRLSNGGVRPTIPNRPMGGMRGGGFRRR